MFIFMFAGHEANANTLTFAILLLACHPTIQKRLQHDIDVSLDSSGSSNQAWSYEAMYPLLTENMVGAVINEALRLATVLPFLPKAVSKNTPQSISIGGRNHMIPANTLILINTSATHRHPKFWSQPSHSLPSSSITNPVASFNPQQWLSSRDPKSEESNQSNSFLHPHPGTFVPFSDGTRGCLGRKFALIELYALIARIFSEYSVELVVEGLVPGANKVTKKKEWEKVRANAEYQLSDGVKFEMSLRLTGQVPVTFVKRGKERFADL